MLALLRRTEPVPAPTLLTLRPPPPVISEETVSVCAVALLIWNSPKPPSPR